MTKKKDKTAKRVAALERELAELKAAVKPAAASRMLSKEEQDRWVDEMHKLREARASQIPPWMQRECAGGVTAAAGDAGVRGPLAVF